MSMRLSVSKQARSMFYKIIFSVFVQALGQFINILELFWPIKAFSSSLQSAWKIFKHAQMRGGLNFSSKISEMDPDVFDIKHLTCWHS